MSARQKPRARRRYVRKSIDKKKTPRVRSIRALKAFILLLILGGIVYYIHSSSKFWDASQKLSVAYPRSDGSVGVAVFDPSLEEINVIVIPESTEITTAHQLGIWKIKSLWELGINEGLRGSLLSQSITNHMQMPINAWADQRFQAVVEGSSSDMIRSVFFSSSNLGFVDKLKIALFAIRINNARFMTINLENTGFLEEKVLTDGTQGYTLYGSMPEELAAVFTASVFSNREVTARIIDSSGKGVINDEVATLLQVLGVKVAAIKTGSDQTVDCTVRGEREDDLRIIAQLFDCTTELTNNTSSFDIEFEFGEEFIRRF